MAKPKITAKKWGGDDAYSWAVFVNGRPAVTGLLRSQVAYYRKLVEQQEQQAGIDPKLVKGNS